MRQEPFKFWDCVSYVRGLSVYGIFGLLHMLRRLHFTKPKNILALALGFMVFSHCQYFFIFIRLSLFDKAVKPKANFAHYITRIPLTDSMPEFFPEVSLPTQLNQAQKMSNHYNWNCFAIPKSQLFSNAMKPILHIFKLLLITFSLETNEVCHPKINVTIGLGICL